MKPQLKEIQLGKGLGNLTFGMKRSEVELLLGKPSLVDSYSHSDSNKDLTESWEYDALEISLNFDKDEDWKLIMMSVSNEACLFLGQELVGKEINFVADFLKTKYDDIYIEDFSESDDEDHKVIELEEQSVNFWFVDGILDEIQWSPQFKDDDTIIWP